MVKSHAGGLLALAAAALAVGTVEAAPLTVEEFLAVKNDKSADMFLVGLAQGVNSAMIVYSVDNAQPKLFCPPDQLPADSLRGALQVWLSKGAERGEMSLQFALIDALKDAYPC